VFVSEGDLEASLFSRPLPGIGTKRYGGKSHYNVRCTSVSMFRRNILPQSSGGMKLFQDNDDVVRRRKCVAYKLYIISSGDSRVVSCGQTDGQTGRQT